MLFRSFHEYGDLFRSCLHSGTLTSPLKHNATAVSRTHSSMFMRDVIELHTSACSHVVCIVQDTLCFVCWKVLDHPTYSLDMLQCDFHVFNPFKKALKGCRLGLGADVEAVMVQWFQQEPGDFFMKGIHWLYSSPESKQSRALSSSLSAAVC
jgi:hypothetical protein